MSYITDGKVTPDPTAYRRYSSSCRHGILPWSRYPEAHNIRMIWYIMWFVTVSYKNCYGHISIRRQRCHGETTENTSVLAISSRKGLSSCNIRATEAFVSQTSLTTLPTSTYVLVETAGGPFAYNRSHYHTLYDRFVSGYNNLRSNACVEYYGRYDVAMRGSVVRFLSRLSCRKLREQPE